MAAFDKYLQLILDAIKNVPKEFFKVEVATDYKGHHKAKSRERVYAYELYHQMRCLQTDRSIKPNEFNINAEIDKRSHPIIKEEFNPDIIIHSQGSMTNYAVIEIKVSINKKGLKKDFRTINDMMDKYGYIYGVFIVAGHSMDKLEISIKELLKETPEIKKHWQKIYIFAQEHVNEPVEVITLKDFFVNHLR